MKFIKLYRAQSCIFCICEKKIAELPTDYHHISIMKLSVHWCVWKVEEGFPDRVQPETLKWVVVYSTVSFPNQWIAQRQVGPVSVYCDGVGCRVCSMSFLCGSTLVKVPLLHAGTVVI